MKSIARLAVILPVFMFVTVAHAGSITSVDIEGDFTHPNANQLGDYEGSITYDSTLATPLLTVSLKNTMPVGTGFLTGLLFNVAGDVTLSKNAFPNTGFILMEPPSSGSPFGNFEWGAAIGGMFTGGGAPGPGIPLGSTGIFKFDVTGTDAGILEAIDFFTEGSTASGAKKVPFVVRFKGINIGAGSDKVPGIIRDPRLPPTGGAVPLPSAVWAGLSMLGLLAAASWRRHR